jgi:hypothetical protein
MLEITQLYLRRDQKMALKRIAHERSQIGPKKVSMAELVRDSIDLFLSHLLHDTKHDDSADVQEDAITK